MVEIVRLDNEFFYGRRHGRIQSQHQIKLLEDVLPTLSLSLDTLDSLPWWSQFKEYHLEIGCGQGEHLSFKAATNPNIGFIGCEPFLSGVGHFLHQHEPIGFENIRLFVHDARLLLEKLPANSLTSVYIFFPDPWPKKRHHKRRIVCQAVLAQIVRILKPQGRLYLATDHEDYWVWMQRAVQKVPALKSLIQETDQPSFPWVQTRYQKKAIREGRTPHFWTLEVGKE